MLAFVLANFVDRHRFGCETRRGFSFAQALPDFARSVPELMSLSDEPVQAHPPHFEDDTHAASGRLLQQLVIAEVRTLPICDLRFQFAMDC